MEIAQLYEIFKEYPNVTTDTRKSPKDSIFFALKGSNFNGNEYAEQALAQGCKYAIVDEDIHTNGNPHIILVDNVLNSLQQLAMFHRSKFKIPVIGITGTNGKTTSKELITAVLSEQFKVLSTEGNLNNHIGVPLTLLRIKKEHEIVVIEMGANHVGEIKRLCEIANPNYGLITNIGHAHIEGFGSFENIIIAKGELYDYLEARDDAKFFMDYNNIYLRGMVKENLAPIYYGVGDDEDLFVKGKIVSINPYLSFSWKFSMNPHIVATQLIGEYNLSNVLAATTIGKYFGVRSTNICDAIEKYTPTNNRSQLKKTENNTLIIDAYNANPTSMDAAINNFAKIDASNKVLILGDMKELGVDSHMEHQKIVNLISRHGFESVYLIGSNFNQTKSSFSTFLSLDDFKDYLLSNPLVNKYILIKGSRGIQLEKCLELL